MSVMRKTLLPVPAHMSQTEVDAYLRKQVRVDAEKAGWLAACTRSGGRTGTVFYATQHVVEVSARIAGGEYPVKALSAVAGS